MTPEFWCEVCHDPDCPCDYEGAWQGIATFYCPDCGTHYEVDRDHFDEDGQYVGEPMPEKEPRYELRGGRGNWAVFDTGENRVRSWHSDKSVAEGRVNDLNNQDE